MIFPTLDREAFPSIVEFTRPARQRLVRIRLNPLADRLRIRSGPTSFTRAVCTPFEHGFPTHTWQFRPTSVSTITRAIRMSSRPLVKIQGYTHTHTHTPALINIVFRYWRYVFVVFFSPSTVSYRWVCFFLCFVPFFL